MIEVTRPLKQKFWNKRVDASKEGIEFSLTLEEFVALMEDANISIDDLHIKGHHLSRYNDSGSYTKDNCRFVPYLVNYSEKKVSDKARNASRQNMIRYRKSKNM